MEHNNQSVSGEFVDLHGDRFYKITHVDQMPAFFISLVSASDHWLFISSTGGLTAGRIRPENALFPYRSVDHIHENADNTGSKTIIKVEQDQQWRCWEPFNPHHDGLYCVERHVYKNTVGDQIVFEEINHTLGLSFCYRWCTSEAFGFVRHATLRNLSDASLSIELLDGIQNLLPAGAPLAALQTRSALVDAYKWNERVNDSSLALFSMYAALSDKAEPAESLRATTVFSVGVEQGPTLLSSTQLKAFRQGKSISAERHTRGVRGAYFVTQSCQLDAGDAKQWWIVAEIDQTHSDIAALEQTLHSTADLAAQIELSIEENHDQLKKLMSGADAWQLTSQETTTVHHYANVLFNAMRGGIFAHNYDLEKSDFRQWCGQTNRVLAKKHHLFLDNLPNELSSLTLLKKAQHTGDKQLQRLCYEYLPLTFGRRHGDPSRPWNHYEIKVRNKAGERLLSYQGNWRDIFQNWEALALSYPNFIASFIAKFVNASTFDGYNPYRISKDGIDWEVVDADDPWSNIGYWGDHQIIYLLKFLELANQYHPEWLQQALMNACYSYANVPYRMCGVEQLYQNPKETIEFDHQRQAQIDQRVASMGSDGRLLLDEQGEVYLVSLLEKILVPLLSKLSNLVVDGGIWLNTQRPEWNDANNAIVGNGLSMVTLYYLRRYVVFMQKMLLNLPAEVRLSTEVTEWLLALQNHFAQAASQLAQRPLNDTERGEFLETLQHIAHTYRAKVYPDGFSGQRALERDEILSLLDASLVVIDNSIAHNKRADGLYHAYNIIKPMGKNVSVETLYPMLEGQVAVLSSGALSAQQAVQLLDRLFDSDLYRPDQQSFMLYPDRPLATFMEKNTLEADLIHTLPWLARMVEERDTRLVERDINGQYHFNPEFANAGDCARMLEQMAKDNPALTQEDRETVLACYESVFNHRQFTGRSGTMFGYEGLGCIYWHMVSKLLLAVQENYLAARAKDAQSTQCHQLADYYYRIREGIGFNKTPATYGAFPTDPYSHTPKQAGAQQPGMTGQVKEEILTRFNELGIQVIQGRIHINPSLLPVSEFLTQPQDFEYVSLNGERQTIALPAGCLAFTYCQVPFIYRLSVNGQGQCRLYFRDSSVIENGSLPLSREVSERVFARNGDIERIEVDIPASWLRQ
ncbi:MULTISPECIES: hypothetical protein [unclassified Vibrio]|uniref:Cellobiose phosphorylase n=1 Tax=Vibrio sp. HB236076 TaxID=3232307 RepID=A0AB39HI77_9VIBR|nr:hypothetical protein [Vibrio sp. HB161653]MDP5252725.1 hypothetical protein [Vibrio sp. HB161653]